MTDPSGASRGAVQPYPQSEISMTQRIEHHGLQVAANLNQFIEQEALPGTGLDAASFWQGFGAGA